MSIKSEFNMIYNTTDMVSGGLLTTIKNSIVNTYKGYFEDKFNELMSDLLKNKITEKEVLEWVEKLGDTDKDIYFSILNKNLLSEIKIKRFLLSKILFHKIKNDKLDYFHSNLLTNIDLFVEEDFENIYTISNKCYTDNEEKNKEMIFINESDFLHQTYKLTISKLKSIGLIGDDLFFGEIGEDEKVNIVKNKFLSQLFEYIEDYYSNYSS